MPFPTDRLEFKCEMGFGVDPDAAFVNPIAWSDVTEYFLDQTVTINRGRANETEDTQVMTLSYELDNNTGVFTPDNPESILYGYVKRGVPVRYGIYGGQSYLQLPDITATNSYVSTPDAAVLDITGDLDVAFEIQPYAVEFANAIFGKWRTTGNQRSWNVILQRQSESIPGLFRLALQWSTDGTAAGGSLVDTTNTFSYNEKLALRITMDVNNGAGGKTINFYTANKWGQPWILFHTEVIAGTTSIFNSTAPLDVGGPNFGLANFIGKTFRVQVRNGIGGTLVADADFTALEPGVVGFTDSVGRVWTVFGNAEITNLHTRFTGQVDSYEVTWPHGDTTGDVEPECRVAIQASSIRRKLGQGEEPLQSVLTRMISSKLLTDPVAYWPMEDESGSTSAASAIANYPSAITTGFTFGEESGFAGASATTSIASVAYLEAEIPTYTNTGGFTVGFLHYLETMPVISQRFLRFRMSGSTLYDVLIEFDATDMFVKAYTVDGTEVLNGAFAHGDVFEDTWGYWLFTVYDSGGGAVDVDIFWSPGDGTFPIATGFSIAGQTMGRLRKIFSTFGSQLVGMRMGHLVVIPEASSDPFTENGVTARTGETGQVRFRRLCDEEGIYTNDGEVVTAGTPMGPQPLDTFLSILDEAAFSSNAILLDTRFFMGLQFIPLYDLQNQPPQLELDAAEEHITNPISPTLDDQHIRNKIQSNRVGGSYAIREDEISINEEGLYSDSVTVNVETDDQLVHDANWRLNIGTAPGMTYPPITMELAKAPDLIPVWLDENTDVGCMLTLENLPRQADSTPKEFILQGYTETITPTKWTVLLNCTPYDPYRVTVFSPNAWDPLRLDAENSTLDAAINNSQTTFTVDLNGGAAWTDADAPFDISVGGEHMTVSDIAAVVSDSQVFTVTRSVNGIVKSHQSGSRVSLAKPVHLALVGDG